MKKKILFICFNMKVGGIQKSLLNLINNIHDEFEITLFLFFPKGAYLNDVPPDVQIIFPKKRFQIIGSSQNDFKNPFLFFLRGLLVVLCRLFGSHKILKKYIKHIKIRNHFDYSISYSQDCGNHSILCGCNFVALNSNSTQKISFIHADINNGGQNFRDNFLTLERFDKICCVSTWISKQLSEHMGKTKIFTIKNTHNLNSIISLGMEECMIKDSICNFVSVCRLGPEKGIDRIIEACKELDKEKLEYNWYVVGGGIDLSYYKKIVSELSLRRLFFVGEYKNPYPFIYKSDFLVISSYIEAAPMIIDEAQILGTKIVSTDFGYAREQLPSDCIIQNCNASFVSFIKNICNNINPLKQNKNVMYGVDENNKRIQAFVDMLES